MAFFSEYVDRVQVGAQITDTIAMRPIAVRENGTLLAMVQDFADGDATFPNIVNRAPLRVRTANDGMRRFLPIPGNDTVYFEMGQPFVQIAGDWTQVSLGTPSRVGKVLTWARPQTITTVKHGGHFLDMQIELLGGYVPENSRIAFPVGLTGLTRSGLNILRGGVAVARLRPFAMIDAADPRATPRPITHNFTTRNGQPFLVLTLPSLAGMVRPVIDPTVELQPDGTAGLDAMIFASTPTTNYETSDLAVGFSSGIGARATLIKFDLTTVPDTFDSAALALTVYGGAGAGTQVCKVYRIKRAWVEAQATWNIYSTGNSWETAGALGANDVESSDIGSQTLDRSTTGVYTWALTPTTKTDLDLGNGWVARSDAGGSNPEFYIRQSEYATAANRPKLAVTYTEAAGALLHYMQQLSYRGGAL